MTGGGYEEFGRDDFDRKGVGAERGYETVGQRDRVDFDPRSQRQGRFGDYDDYGDEYGAPSPMRPYYETEFSGGIEGPEDAAMRGHGSYQGGEPRQRGGTDAVDYDRGYTSERRGPTPIIAITRHAPSAVFTVAREAPSRMPMPAAAARRLPTIAASGRATTGAPMPASPRT